jgi:excisionase family DNA binding protein
MISMISIRATVIPVNGPRMCNHLSMTTAIATNRPRNRRRHVPVEPLAYSISTAAQATTLSERALQRLIANEEIGVVRAGRRVLIPKTALENFLQQERKE